MTSIRKLFPYGGGVLLCLLLPAVSVTAGTGYHRWVDEDGTVHFSQNPPSGADTPAGKVEQGKIKFAPENEDAIKAQEKALQELNQRAEERQEARHKDEQEQMELAKQKEECARIRKQINLHGAGGRLRTNDTRQVVTEEERQRRLDKLNQQLGEHCQ